MKMFRLMDPARRGCIAAPLTKTQMAARERFLQALSDGAIRLEHVEHCPCGSASLEQIANRDRFGFDFGVFLCMHCGLLMTNPVISEASLSTYYSEYYHDLHLPVPYDECKFLYRQDQGERVFSVLRPFLPDKEDLTMLDLGSGTGHVTRFFVQEATKEGFKAAATALDYNPAIQEKLADEPNIEVIVGGLENLGSQSRIYDVVIMSHALEHFRDIDKQLALLKSHLRESSLIYVGVPGLFRLKYSCEYSCDFLKYFTSAHMYHFNLVSLSHMMGRSGFRLVWGDETVDAIYKLGEGSVNVEANADNVMAYLQDLEQNLTFYQHLSEIEQKVHHLEQTESELRAAIEKIRRFAPIRAYLFLEKKINDLLRGPRND